MLYLIDVIKVSKIDIKGGFNYVQIIIPHTRRNYFKSVSHLEDYGWVATYTQSYNDYIVLIFNKEIQ